jgi:UDP-N-acetylmuramyl pentapeptide synthase
MELARLIAAIEPTDVVNPAACEIADLAYDTRALSTGALFFCVPGAKVDGHDLAAAAVAGGAVALVVERHLGASAQDRRLPSRP